jgi:hypothetical protein
MDIESRLSGHWTDDQLIEHLYDVGPEDGHLRACRACQARLAAVQSARRALETDYLAADTDSASYDFLMAQRRRIYARLGESTQWWTGVSVRRWAPVFAMLLLLAGGFFMYDQRSRQDVSDVELASQVSCMATDSEPPSTAPLHALFEQ